MSTTEIEKAFKKIENDFQNLKEIFEKRQMKDSGELSKKVDVKKMNKSQLIRDCFKRLGENARPRDVIEQLKKEHGIEIAASLVSITKSKMNGGLKNKEKEELEKKEDSISKVSLPKAIQMALDENKDGLGIKGLSEVIEKFGYKYNGSKGDVGRYNNVYQCAHSLSQEKVHPGHKGTEPVVIHDKSKHIYYLNPKAQKSA